MSGERDLSVKLGLVSEKMMRIERPSPDTDNERGAIPTNVVIDNIVEDPCVFLGETCEKV